MNDIILSIIFKFLIYLGLQSHIEGFFMPNRNYLFFFITFIFLFQLNVWGQEKRLEKDSKHFRIIYKKEEAYLVNNLINYAETSLSDLDSVFNFRPSEKIIIYLSDYSDYGYGTTTTVPENFIRLEIEPLELAYENIPLKKRIRWLISHELVHVIVNDQASSFEKTMRVIFSKVPPEQEQPLTVFYSLITNHNRYTPVWYQEGIAVFFETWENGGFGRVLSNFDEMYFRTLVAENKNFPSINKLDAKLNVTSFLQGTAFYLYGTRFCTYLSINYGTKKLLSWYKEKPAEFYENYTSKFRDIFGLPLNKAWKDFINNEKKFQLKNISRIKKGKLTNIIRLSSKSDGWITKEYYEPSENLVIFGYNAPNHLAGIKKLYLKNKLQVKIGTLPTPSLVRVASTAYDKNNKLFFYTTKNNELFRDLNVLDINTGDSKLLFKNCRIGDITVSPQNHDLWGVIHSDGRTGIVYSSYPYKELKPIVGFNLGDDISDLSVSPDGKFLAGVLHRSSGSQLIFLTSCDTLKKTNHFRYLTITDKGSPEFPSWSNNGNILFWNAYVNGVSNIYRKNLASDNSDIEPVSNVVDGLFKPVYINKDSLFAFEFTSKGFKPVIIPNKEAEFLPAIKYFGDEVVAKDPQVTRWNLSDNKNNTQAFFDSSKDHDYNSIASLKVTSLVPVITGFQDQKVLGIYTHISDPLLINDLTMEFGISPFKNNSNLPEFHFKGKYEYRKELTLNYEFNPTDFYDLFNKRKRGLTGSRYGMEYSHYWIYSNPLKLIQKFGVDYYTGIKFLTDNI